MSAWTRATGSVIGIASMPARMCSTNARRRDPQHHALPAHRGPARSHDHGLTRRRRKPARRPHRRRHRHLRPNSMRPAACSRTSRPLAIRRMGARHLLRLARLGQPPLVDPEAPRPGTPAGPSPGSTSSTFSACLTVSPRALRRASPAQGHPARASLRHPPALQGAGLQREDAPASAGGSEALGLHARGIVAEVDERPAVGDIDDRACVPVQDPGELLGAAGRRRYLAANQAIALAQCDDPLIKQAGLRFG